MESVQKLITDYYRFVYLTVQLICTFQLSIGIGLKDIDMAIGSKKEKTGAGEGGNDDVKSSGGGVSGGGGRHGEDGKSDLRVETLPTATPNSTTIRTTLNFSRKPPAYGEPIKTAARAIRQIILPYDKVPIPH